MLPMFSPEERRLAFEARRLAAETLAKVYLEHTQGARQLVMAHLRQMFTLSLGALAGIITLYGTILRFGSANSISAITYYEIALGILGLAALIASALITASALQRAAFDSVNRLSYQAPEIDVIFRDEALNENEILLKLYVAVSKGLETQVLFKRETRWSVGLLIAGLLAAVTSFLV